MGERSGGVRRGQGGFDAPDDDEAGPGSGRRRGLGRGLTALFVLSIGGLVLYLAWCLQWERNHPASPAARAVRAGEAAARLRAIADLERLGPEDPDVVFPALIAALDDPGADVRAAAAPALMMVIQGVGVGVPDPQQVGDAVQALLGRTKDPQAVVRTSAIQALWMIVIVWQGAPRLIEMDAIAVAIGEAAADPDFNVRLAGVRGLGVIGQKLSEDPPPRLVAALEDESEAVRGAAAQALALYRRGLVRLLPSLLKSLESARTECRPAYFALLKQVGPLGRPLEEVKEMVSAFMSARASPDREVRRQVVESLGQLATVRPPDRAAIAALTIALDDPDDDVRSSAARALIALGPAARAAIPGLIRSLQQAWAGRSARDAARMADVIRTIAPARPEAELALGVLLELLQIEPELQDIDMVIDALAPFGRGAAPALPRLNEMARSANPRVGEAARKAVAALGGPIR